MIDKYRLIGQGIFPETLPPCFDGMDLKRAFRGFVPTLRERKFYKRSGVMLPFSGTKHDGSRRTFSTPNPVTFFHVCEFIHKNWEVIESRISDSPLIVSKPKPSAKTADRPIIIPSLSNLTTEASEKLRFSPIIVKADISQFFASIYTHAIPWVAHGREAAKADQAHDSETVKFNQLDVFVQRCQSGETRGVGVGSDAFRIIAEFIGSEIDRDLISAVGDKIIGGARHVDDFFLGVRTESDAQEVLSALRSVLSKYHFQLNDSKTKIISGLQPLNEVWAQDLRRKVSRLSEFNNSKERLILIFNESTNLATELNSDSPVKIYLRGIDDARVYNRPLEWSALEPYLQRVCFHHPHCIDYVFLLVAKRFAIGQSLEKGDWIEVALELIRRSKAFGHDHEIFWSLWLLIVLGADIDQKMINGLCEYSNVYLNAMLITAKAEDKIDYLPLKFGSKIESNDSRWLEGLVARSVGYSKARFKGDFSEEFSHLADKKLKLIDFDRHMNSIKKITSDAISHSRYGYDSDDEDDYDGFDEDEDEDPF